MGGGLELNITGHKLTDIDVYLNTLAVVQDPRSDEWMAGRFSSLDDETLHGPLGDVSLVAIQRSANPSAVGDEEYDGEVNFDDEESLWNEEALQREKNLGFTNSEVNELLSHGVRPYDDNAWVRAIPRPAHCGPYAHISPTGRVECSASPIEDYAYGPISPH